MSQDELGNKLGHDILKIIHSPFGSQKVPDIPHEPESINLPKKESSDDLASQFFHQAIEARYSVFQLVGRKVVKKDGLFEVEGKGWSHTWEADGVRNFMHDKLSLEIMDLDARKKRLNMVPGAVGENQVGVVSLYIDHSGKNTRLIIFGHFSLESRPLAERASIRTNGENSIYYVLSGENASAIQDLVGKLNTEDKTTDANIHNRECIVGTMSSIFPESIFKFVDSHMLRQLEVDKIIDRRK